MFHKIFFEQKRHFHVLMFNFSSNSFKRNEKYKAKRS